MNKRMIIAAIGTIVAIIAVLQFALPGNQNDQVMSTPDIKQLVENYSLKASSAKNISITSRELIVTEKNNKVNTYPLPADEFFVSIAPYRDQTHPCANHNLTGCQGEMEREEVKLLIKNEDGTTFMDQSVNTLSNGFIDLWLPRNAKYAVTIKQDGKIAESEITTFDGDNTCITTMQLL